MVSDLLQYTIIVERDGLRTTALSDWVVHLRGVPGDETAGRELSGGYSSWEAAMAVARNVDRAIDQALGVEPPRLSIVNPEDGEALVTLTDVYDALDALATGLRRAVVAFEALLAE